MSAKALSSRSLTFVVVVVVDLVDIDLVDEQASLVDEQACAEHSLLRATRERSSHSPRSTRSQLTIHRLLLHPAPAFLGPRARGVVCCSFFNLQGVLQVAACHIPNHACCGILVVPLGAFCPLERTYTIVPLPSILDMEPCFFEYGAVAREPIRQTPVISGPTPSPCGSACACNEHPAALSWILR